MSNLGFALPKCFFCRKDKNEILMNRRLSPGLARQVADMHGKIVDMNPCSECEEWMNRGVLLISVRDGEKLPGSGKMPNPYRTGGWAVVTPDAFSRIMTEIKADKTIVESAIKHRWTFIEDSVWCMLGLPRYGAGQQVRFTRDAYLSNVDTRYMVKFKKGDHATVIGEDGRWVFVIAVSDGSECAEAVLQTTIEPRDGVPPVTVDVEKFNNVLTRIKTWHADT